MAVYVWKEGGYPTVSRCLRLRLRHRDCQIGSKPSLPVEDRDDTLQCADNVVCRRQLFSMPTLSSLGLICYQGTGRFRGKHLQGSTPSSDRLAIVAVEEPGQPPFYRLRSVKYYYLRLHG